MQNFPLNLKIQNFLKEIIKKTTSNIPLTNNNNQIQIFLNNNKIFLLISIPIILTLFLKLIISKFQKKPEKNLLEKLNLKINYYYIDKLVSLKKIKKQIERENISKIGIDTEYSKTKNQKGHLCLMQISLCNKNGYKFIYIIDLLKFNKIQIKENLEKILNNKHIEKIIHSSYNDFEWIFEEYGIFTKNIFDTQEFYSIFSEEEKKVGLNFLLKKYFEINLDKETKKNYQTSDWNKRPLEINQLQYSAIDTYYLIDLRQKIFEDFYKKFDKEIFLRKLNSNKKSSRKFIKKIKEELNKKFTKEETELEGNFADKNYEYYLLENFEKEKDLNNKDKEENQMDLEEYFYIKILFLFKF